MILSSCLLYPQLLTAVYLTLLSSVLSSFIAGYGWDVLLFRFVCLVSKTVYTNVQGVELKLEDFVDLIMKWKNLKTWVRNWISRILWKVTKTETDHIVLREEELHECRHRSSVLLDLWNLRAFVYCVPKWTYARCLFSVQLQSWHGYLSSYLLQNPAIIAFTLH